MKARLTEFLVHGLSLLDAYPTRRTGRQDILNLIGELHPVDSGKALIRLGPKGDGGYLVPDDLQDIQACFSPGVSTISGFEKDCAERNMLVFMADRSVDGPAEAHESFTFTKKFIGATSSSEFMTLDDWVRNSLQESNEDLLMQMDIEGSEYEVLLSASDKLIRRLRIVVVEFHNLHMLWSKPFFTLASCAFRKLLQTHLCVHIHPNNCCGSVAFGGLEIPRVGEFTFLRRDRIIGDSWAKTFPHPLDFDNTGNPTLPLPDCWYRQKSVH